MMTSGAFPLPDFSWWPKLVTPLADHLWQSTLFALLIAAAAGMLRKNRPQIRYRLWLCASAKFLIPFSLLAALGAALAPSTRQVSAGPAVLWVGRNLARPFASGASLAPSGNVLSASAAHILGFVAQALLVLWFLGFAFVLIRFLTRWRRVSLMKRDSAPGNYSREQQLLRRARSLCPTSRAFSLVFTHAAVDPGLVGILRPAILLPVGIAENLTDAELTAILVHELCHLRRRDNLGALFHMLVQALFWFHPLLWFIGAKLLDESERSCDQEVLAAGTPAQIYAEGILKVCRFCLDAPVACASGIAGSNLKKRMEDIMNYRVWPQLSLPKKAALVMLAALVLIAPITYGALHPAHRRPAANINSSAAPNAENAIPAYESVSIKASSDSTGMNMVLLRPDGFTARNLTLRTMIVTAYGLQDEQLAGGPDWIDSAKYDIDARAGLSVVAEAYKPGENPTLPGEMVKALLADRFHLVLRKESKQQQVLALTFERANQNLHPAKTSDAYADGFKGPDGKPAGPGLWENASAEQITLTGQGIPVRFVTRLASGTAKRIVVDKTGLSGKYDFTLTVKSTGANTVEPMFSFSEEALNDALRQQLGLQLLSQQAEVDVMTIEHAEKPKID